MTITLREPSEQSKRLDLRVHTQDTDYISDNLEQQYQHLDCDPSIKSDRGQHSQFLQCFQLACMKNHSRTPKTCFTVGLKLFGYISSFKIYFEGVTE